MHITINTDVLCDGKYCGRSTYLIVSLVNERVTQPVGAEKKNSPTHTISSLLFRIFFTAQHIIQYGRNHSATLNKVS